MADVKDYVRAIAPPWLLAAYGEALLLVLGLIGDAHGEGTREAVALRFVDAAPLDALDDHGADRQIARAPGEGLEAFRQRLLQAWDAWALAGTGAGILLQLEPAGITSATIVEGASADPSVPSTWATWYVRVHEPHPFVAPFLWGAGRDWGDGWLWGFGAPDVIEYARAIVRKWRPAHAHSTGIVVEFSSPTVDVRIPT